MAAALFLRPLFPNDVIELIRDVIVARKKLEILRSAKNKLLSDTLLSYDVVDIIDNVIERCSDFAYLEEYAELKKTVRSWVAWDAWENEYNGGPGARYRENNYDALLIFSGKTFLDVP
jgi:hypothetical protein